MIKMSTAVGVNRNLTCITCLVAFKDNQLQRLHYKSDWHRYNLTRKIAELPPITIEAFQKRVTQLQDEKKRNSKPPQSLYCIACKKSFSNLNAYSNHSKSHKHRENTKLQGNNEVGTWENDVNLIVKSDTKMTDMNTCDDSLKNITNLEDDMEIESDDWSDCSDECFEAKCLFCGIDNRNFFNNLEHMTAKHSFFIPDIEFCTDIPALLNYLGQKVEIDFICIWCNDKGRTFYTASAVRSHMLDKGHCKMLHEGAALAEYVDFYDYSTSYPDANADNIDIDEELNIPEAEQLDEYQLILPSGAVIGHRSLMRYYKQNLSREDSVVAISPHARVTQKLHKVLATYRMLGWTATQQEAAARKAKDIHYMKRMQSKLYMKLGVKANRLQKHFRQQINF